jgi:hypothetical protein
MSGGEQFWLGVGIGAFTTFVIWAVRLWAKILVDDKIRRLHEVEREEAKTRHPSAR